MMYNIDKEVNKMADIRISPQGYVYGEEPLSDHPFWDEGPAGADQYVKEVTGSSTTEGTVTTYDIKYTDQDDVSHDVISIPVDSAGGGGSDIPGEPDLMIGTLALTPLAGYRMVTSTQTITSAYYLSEGSTLTNFEDFTLGINMHPISEDKCIVDVDLDINYSLRNTIANLFGLSVPGQNNQYGSTSMHISQICNYSKTGNAGQLEVMLEFYLPFTARTSASGTTVAGWIGYFSAHGVYNLTWF